MQLPMIEYRKLSLEKSRFQLQFTLENLREDVTKISQFIHQLLLCDGTATVSQQEVARQIVKAYLAGDAPLSNLLFSAEGDCVAGHFRCWAKDAAQDLPGYEGQENPPVRKGGSCSG
jgi:hypothetical protein